MKENYLQMVLLQTYFSERCECLLTAFTISATTRYPIIRSSAELPNMEKENGMCFIST